nr:alpha/beta hydrolase [uncultured Flavobacterium sp.]
MKKRLIILSDLWGYREHSWINTYSDYLKKSFDIQIYDCCVLGNIKTDPYTEKHIHQQFVDYGIEQAVQALLNLEKSEVYVLGFSIGGTIAWKAACEGLNVKQLYAVSATRLRYETTKPNLPIRLYFGENDLNSPTNDWFTKITCTPTLLSNQDHEFYTQKEFAASICKDILNTETT